ncbi:MAG TPA: hypothetical protein VK530_11590, partial [Candidatus Acidoferrum sp.]|nr:hypothetical protein [Candidatus Acidoferrum sp.]
MQKLVPQKLLSSVTAFPRSVGQMVMLILLWLGLGMANAGTLTVLNTGDSGAGSLRQAILDANAGDTITFDNTLTGSTIVLTSGQLLIDKSVNIVGLGADKLAVSGGGNSRVFLTTNGTIAISGLTITGGNSSTVGGGIHNERANMTLNYCAVTGNSCGEHGGGVHTALGTATIANSTVSGNTAGIFGGGIWFQTELIVMNSTVSGNQTGRDGGGIYNFKAQLFVSNSTVSGNSATIQGGGIENVFGGQTIANSIVAGNTAPTGPD